jgi:hypothetical protein
MQIKLLRNWSGLFSIMWLAGVYFVLRFSAVPEGLFRLILIWLWLSLGLLLGVLGLRCGSFAGRASALVAIGLFLFFAWSLLCPRVQSVRVLQPKQVASVAAGMPFLPHAGRHRPATSEPRRWLCYTSPLK